MKKASYNAGYESLKGQDGKCGGILPSRQPLASGINVGIISTKAYDQASLNVERGSKAAADGNGKAALKRYHLALAQFWRSFSTNYNNSEALDAGFDHARFLEKYCCGTLGEAKVLAAKKGDAAAFMQADSPVLHALEDAVWTYAKFVDPTREDKIYPEGWDGDSFKNLRMARKALSPQAAKKAELERKHGLEELRPKTTDAEFEESVKYSIANSNYAMALRKFERWNECRPMGIGMKLKYLVRIYMRMKRFDDALDEMERIRRVMAVCDSAKWGFTQKEFDARLDEVKARAGTGAT